MINEELGGEVLKGIDREVICVCVFFCVCATVYILEWNSSTILGRNTRPGDKG